MDVETPKHDQTAHLEVSPKPSPEEEGFEGLSAEETNKLEKRRE